MSDLLQAAGASPNATTLIFSAVDGYTTELPLDYTMQNNIILAYKMNNVTLTPDAGFPLMPSCSKPVRVQMDKMGNHN